NVTLSNPTYQTITVRYDTANGTATAGSDYQAVVNGTVTFAPNQTNQTITILVNGDRQCEPDETFSVSLSNPAASPVGSPNPPLISNAQSTATILNDDAQPIVSCPNSV